MVSSNHHLFAVGNSIYEAEDEFKRIDYAKTDAEAVFDLLTGSETSIFSKESSLLKTNISIDEFWEEISAFFDRVERNDMVMFYFAGHGVPIGGKWLFLVMPNSIPGKIASTAFSIESIIPFLEESKTKRYVIILDCCYAGKATKSPGIKSRGEDAKFKIPIGGQGKVVIASANEFQLAKEIEELGHGLFSYYFLDGIRSGNATLPAKEYISALDVFEFASGKIQEEYPSLSQEPIYSGDDVTGQLWIAKNLNFKEANAAFSEIQEFMRKTLDVDDLSDVEKLRFAQLRKFREYLNELKEITNEVRKFENLAQKYGQALGLPKDVINVEFQQLNASIAFDLATPSAEVYDSFINGKGKAIIFGTTFGGLALESPTLGGGLFSFYLRKSLEGAGANESGQVTLANMFRFVQFEVSGFESGRQQPILVGQIDHEPTITSKSINWNAVKGRRYALLVGVDSYQNPNIPKLLYAESDAKGIQEILSQIGGFETRTFLGENATRLNLEKSLAFVEQELGEDDLFVLYYSGHGFSEQENGSAVLFDDEIQSLGGPLSVQRISQFFRASKVGCALAIFDSCMAPVHSQQLQLVTLDTPAEFDVR